MHATLGPSTTYVVLAPRGGCLLLAYDGKVDMRRHVRRNLLILFVTCLTAIVVASVVRKPAGYYDVYDPSAIQHELTRIATWMKDQAPEMAKQLQPPAERAQILALANPRG